MCWIILFWGCRQLYWETYYQPKTADEALDILTSNQGQARIVAGGTDMMLLLKTGKVKAKALVDITNLEELKFITEENGWIKIGALVTHNQLAVSSLLREKARVLVEAAESIGSPQIRNVGTIGGNVANAQPAADTSVALTALDARVWVKTVRGKEIKPISEMFLGVGKSAIEPTEEFITAFEFKSPEENETTAFIRHAKRKALAMPILNMGLWLKASIDSKVQDIRIVAGPMATVPLRLLRAEKTLKESTLTNKLLKKAGEIAALEVNPRSSIRGSAYYKKEMIKVFLKRAVISAFSDLGGEIK